MLCLIPITLTWRITADVKTLCTNQLSGEPQNQLTLISNKSSSLLNCSCMYHTFCFCSTCFVAWGITKFWTHYIIKLLLAAFMVNAPRWTPIQGYTTSFPAICCWPDQARLERRGGGVSALLHEDRSQWQTLISNSAQDKEFSVKDLANIWPGLSLFQLQWCIYPR